VLGAKEISATTLVRLQTQAVAAGNAAITTEIQPLKERGIE
jgi:hypothetical protein